MTTTFKAMAISIAAFTVLTGCGSSSTSSTTDTPQADGTTQTISGVAVDPQLQGSTVFVDRNNDGNLTQGEPSAITDQNGHYELNITKVDIGKNIIVTGGIDKVTKDRFVGQLLSVVDGNSSTIDISPLSSLVAVYKQRDANKTIDDIKQELAMKLNVNVDAFNTDITQDPTLLSKGMLVAKITGLMQKDENRSALEVLQKLDDELSNAQGLDEAIRNLASKDTNNTLLQIKIEALHNTVKALENNSSLSIDQLALTISNIEQNVTKTDNETELKDLENQVEHLVVQDSEIKTIQEKKILEHLGLDKLDDATKQKIFQNKNVADVTPEDIKKEIMKDQTLKTEIEKKYPDVVTKLQKEVEKQQTGNDTHSGMNDTNMQSDTTNADTQNGSNHDSQNSEMDTHSNDAQSGMNDNTDNGQ